MSAQDELNALVAEFAPQIARDPRPAPVLRVGAMGHRTLPDRAEMRVTAAVNRVLGAIRAAALAATTEPEVAARFQGPLDLVLISPFAQGADQIIATAAEETGYRLGAVLPFEEAEYEKTFDLDGADGALATLRASLKKAEMPDGYGVLVLDGNAAAQARRDEAFLICANHITHWAEVLIAILADDRRDSQSGLGVQQAIDTGMPVIVIDPRDDTVGLYLDAVRVRREDQDARLAAAIRQFFAPPPNEHRGHHHGIGLGTYCAERVVCEPWRIADFEYGGPYRPRTVAPGWARWVSGLNRGIEHLLRRKADAPPASGNPPTSAQDLPFGPHQAGAFVRLFLHFHRADVLAGAYAELYRSAHLLIAFLGVATVTLGALGAVVGVWPPLFSGTEFIALVFALLLVWKSNRQAWLARWTHYRLVAEIYRYAKFLLVAGRPSPFGDSPVAYHVWTRDHTEHVLRTYGLAVPGRGRNPHEPAVVIARRYILGQCIDDQVRFHRKTVPARQRMARFLRNASLVLSAVTVVVLGVKFVTEVLLQTHMHWFDEEMLKPVLTTGEVLAIVLPALTAAVLALRAYGEHDVIAKRSAAMIEALGHERRRVLAAANLDSLGAATMRVVRTLLSDVGGWVDLFVDKHLEA